jgi:lipid A 3-O-deacylase
MTLFQRIMAAALLAAAGLGATPAVAQLGDPEGIFTLVIENDTLAGGNADKHYSNGLRMGWLTPDSGGPSGLWELGQYMPFIDLQARRRMGFAIGHNLYTPEDKNRTDRIFNDRPYGAFLYAGLAYQSQSDRRLDTVELDIGIVGPAALGEPIQNNFHRLIGSSEARGWDNQLDNEPGIALVFERKWRFLAETTGGYGVDLMPHISGSIGNVLTYGGVGLTFRIGEDLAVDFGPPRIRPALPGSASFDKPLDGNTFGAEQSIAKKPFVLDFQAGLSFIISQTRISYTQVWRTQEFEGQKRPDYFGSISISTKF